jgi:hypothetical protein
VRSTVSKEDPERTGDALVLRDTAFGGPQDEGLRVMHLLIAMAGTDPRITSGDGHDVEGT